MALVAGLARLYSYIENLVFWAGPMKIGCTVEICRGKMEYWNVGILKSRVWWNEIYFSIDGTEQEI
jgi:hypothetical protein